MTCSAFISASACTMASSSRTSRKVCISRRDAMVAICSVITAAVVPTATHSEQMLPAGAAQFNRVLTAQRQWESLGTVLNSGRTLEEQEWENMRGILRAVYQVSGDMEYLTQPWSKQDKQMASKDINALRRTLKQMDEPAKQRQLQEFRVKYDEVQTLLQSFLSTFSEASSADIPLEL